jgi:capsular polysaccharide biosynthesis protein
MDKEFNLLAVIRIMLKWKMPIIITTIVAGVAAAIFSVYVMDEYYLSLSTFYPANQYVTDRSMIFNSENTGGQIDYCGGK